MSIGKVFATALERQKLSIVSKGGVCKAWGCALAISKHFVSGEDPYLPRLASVLESPCKNAESISLSLSGACVSLSRELTGKRGSSIIVCMLSYLRKKPVQFSYSWWEVYLE